MKSATIKIARPGCSFINFLDVYIVAIATGRMLKSACIATDGAKFTNYIVSDTGAAVYKNDEKWTDIYINEIPKEDAKNMLTFFDEKKFKDIRNFKTNVILLTRNNEYEYNEEYLKYGFSGYLLKPISKDKLFEIIDKYLK